MTSDNRLANAALEIASARDALRVAAAAVAAGARRDAMSRTYYAAFHAARALLLLEGVEAKTHAGLLRLFAEHVVRAGKLGPSANLLLTRLQAYRQAADYACVFDIDEDDAKRELEAAARAFVEAAAARCASASP